MHTSTILAMESLADLYLDIARCSEARTLLEKALQARKVTGSGNSRDYARCLDLLGCAWMMIGRFDKAEPLLREAFEVTRSLRAPVCRQSLDIIRHLVRAWIRSGRLDEAVPLSHRVQEWIASEDLGTLDAASGLVCIAEVRLAQERFHDAELSSREALTFANELNHPLLLRDSLTVLGATLRDQQKWGEAEACFRQAYALCEEYLAPEHPATAAVLEHLVLLLERTGRSDEAEGWAHHARQIREFHSPLRLL
jgi:tetratricopeptide (TPR) repeat protein